MKVIASLAFISLVSASGSVFAGPAQQGQSLDLAGLKAKCAELSENEQLKPFKAVVSCRQVATEWRPAKKLAPGVQVNNTKEIGASFTLKGYSVPFEAEELEVDPSFASCSLLEQVQITVPAVDVELSCEALDAVDTLSALCSPIIDERVTADPSIVIEEATGATFNSCDGKVSQGSSQQAVSQSQGQQAQAK